MADLSPGAQTETDLAFSRVLRQWRHQRRLSQLELGLRSGVSQRHISFLESGRANPSRGMILKLCDALDVPLRDRNTWLTAAGFAAVFTTRALDDPQLDQVIKAVQMMLTAHEPFPAIALDRAWNIRMSNKPFDLLGAMLGDDLWTRIGGDRRNLMRLIFHPAGLRPFVTNWSAVAPLMWRRAQREAEALNGVEMKAVLADLAPLQDHGLLRSSTDTPLVPVMPFNLKVRAMRLSLFAVVSTFGTAQDITADELRIESLFPADTATETLFRNAVRGSR